MNSDDQELSPIMMEIVEAFGGQAVALTLHPREGGAAELLHLSDGQLRGDAGAIVAKAEAHAARMQEGQTIWQDHDGDAADAVLLIPVEAFPGHSRMIISVFFDAPTAEMRKAAEEVYLRRKPFAVGYFRLWQANRILDRRGQALEAAINLTEVGVLLIDQAGDIAFANDAAERILAAGAGIRRVGRSLRATDLSEGVRLQVALNHVTATTHDGGASNDPEAASILALARKVGPPLIVSLLAPRVGSNEPTDVAAIMFVVDPQLDTARMLEPVCRLYELSTVETTLVSHLAQGKSLAAASDLMRVKEQTARSYMKQIFLKTATNRQNELIVLMLSSVVRMRSGLAQKALGASEIFASAHGARS